MVSDPISKGQITLAEMAEINARIKALLRLA